MKKMKKNLQSFRSQASRGLVIALSMVLIALAVCLATTSCKAWRTISTTATYVQSNDSTKSTATISTKTTEEYVGIRKK